MPFVDTDVLLYAAVPGAEEHAKATVARELLGQPDVVLGAQVLAEFYWQATHPTRPNRLEPGVARRFVTTLRRRPVQPLTSDVVAAGIATAQRFTIAYWDAAILEAARAAGETVVLSEDLSHGQDYDGVVVVDPFRDIT